MQRWRADIAVQGRQRQRSKACPIQNSAIRRALLLQRERAPERPLPARHSPLPAGEFGARLV
jgi:hypothetical protein